MTFLKQLSILLFILMISFSKVAQSYDAIVSLGNICEFIGKIQTDDKGATNVCAFNPYLSSSVDFKPFKNINFAPEIGFTFPQTGRDSNINKMNIVALINAKYTFSMLHLFFGTGFYFTRLSAGGGEEVLNNGNSTTSFPLPDSTVYTRNFILNLGARFPINATWSVDAHTFIFNLYNFEERSFSAVFNLNYHFGEF